MKFILTAANTSPSVKYSLTNKSKMRKGENTYDFVKRVLGDQWIPLGDEFNKPNEIMVIPLFFAKKKDGTYASNGKAQITRQLKDLVAKGWVKETNVRTITLDYGETSAKPRVFTQDAIAKFKNSVRNGSVRGELGYPQTQGLDHFTAMSRYMTIKEDNTVLRIHKVEFSEDCTSITLTYSVKTNIPNAKKLEKLLDEGKVRPGLRAFETKCKENNNRLVISIITFDLIENN